MPKLHCLSFLDNQVFNPSHRRHVGNRGLKGLDMHPFDQDILFEPGEPFSFSGHITECWAAAECGIQFIIFVYSALKKRLLVKRRECHACDGN
jgi:hypothetical protein